jgi:phosphoribosylanthranilate isomerase
VRVRAKICGITNGADARLCIEAGADALGFIFVPGTPRYVEPAAAAAIIRDLPPLVTPVGIFWDHPFSHVISVMRACGLQAVQFHGDEPPEALGGYPVPVIKAVKVRDAADVGRFPRYRQASALLLDSPARWSEGESRPLIPWEVAREAQAAGFRIILSGGLTPDNVAEAIRMVQPFAVDVNSGVEVSPGRKDPDRVRRFMAAVGEAPVGVA